MLKVIKQSFLNKIKKIPSEYSLFTFHNFYNIQEQSKFILTREQYFYQNKSYLTEIIIKIFDAKYKTNYYNEYLFKPSRFCLDKLHITDVEIYHSHNEANVYLIDKPYCALRFNESYNVKDLTTTYYSIFNVKSFNEEFNLSSLILAGYGPKLNPNFIPTLGYAIVDYD